MTLLFWRFVTLIGTAYTLRMGTRVSSKLSLPFSLNPGQALPVPAVESAFNRYCHIDSMSVSHLRQSKGSLMEYDDKSDFPEISTPRENLIYGTCATDDECSLFHSRPFCIEGICRECRSGYEFEDCGTSSAICSAQTSFSCSQCGSDEDCKVGTVCRTVFDQSSYLANNTWARKTCNRCESVPPFGEIVNPANCQWRCPIKTFYSPETDDTPESCLECPVCNQAQFYAPSGSKSEFFSTCTNATNVVCADCASIGIDTSDENFCATILSPDESHQDSVSVGDLGEHLPCRFFQCKSGWFLDHSIRKCKQCHLTMCPPGETLVDCGGTNPGKCVPCPNGRQKPRRADWIIPNDPLYKIHNPLDTCQFICPDNTVLNDENACVRCDPGAPATESLACVDSRATPYRIE
jgi:hypothetical protein